MPPFVFPSSGPWWTALLWTLGVKICLQFGLEKQERDCRSWGQTHGQIIVRFCPLSHLLPQCFVSLGDPPRGARPPVLPSRAEDCSAVATLGTFPTAHGVAVLKEVSLRFLSAPPQARERGFHYRRHPTDAQAEAAGDTRRATAAGDDQVPAGARAGHQGQHYLSRQEVHAHAQGLPQHAPPGGLYLLWGLPRPLRQPRPLCQPRPLRQALWRRLSTLWRPRPLRGIRHLRWFRPLWKLFGLAALRLVPPQAPALRRFVKWHNAGKS